MSLSSKAQRIATAIWPVTLLILTPLIVAEAWHLWRKNRREKREK